MNWIIDNKEWLFSGLGIFLITLIIGIFKKRGSSNSQSLKSGSNSTNVQAKGDVNVEIKNDKR